MLLKRVLLGWRKAKILSVLQNAYDMPFKEPLDSLVDLDLKLVTTIAYDTGGNAFDAAAAFMTMRVKSAFETNFRVGRKVVNDESWEANLAVGFSRTQTLVRYCSVHTAEISQISRLKGRIDERDRSLANAT